MRTSGAFSTATVAVAVVGLSFLSPASAQETTTFYPAEGQFAVVLYEDQFPFMGDFDFNDTALRFHVTTRDKGTGGTEIELTVYPLAVGAGSLCSGLALHLPESMGTPVEATRFPSNAPDSPVEVEPWEGESELVFTLYDDTHEPYGVTEFINTDPAGPFLLAEPMTLKIHFRDPVPIDPAEMPYDLFFYRSGQRDHQVHLPAYAGTDQMDRTLFNTGHDASTSERHFVTSAGLPWVLMIDESLEACWPVERERVEDAFPDLPDFFDTGANPDWYENPNLALVLRESQLPEPASLTVLAVGGLAVLQRRKRR